MAKSRKNYGFTLVELLVVISIIALLLSILMPSLQSARNQAKRVVCASQFRQIGVVQNSYATDWNSWVPRFRVISEFGKPNHIGKPAAWPNVMEAKTFQYIRDTYEIPEKFWFCPSLRRNYKKVYDSQWENGKLVFVESDGHWPDAYWELGVANLVMVSEAYSAAKVTDPGYKVLAADITFLANQDWNDPWSRIAHKGKSLDKQPAAGGNRLHVDGSVKWVTSKVMADDDKPLEPERSWFGAWPQGKNTYKFSNQREWYW